MTVLAFFREPLALLGKASLEWISCSRGACVLPTAGGTSLQSSALSISQVKLVIKASVQPDRNGL